MLRNLFGILYTIISGAWLGFSLLATYLVLNGKNHIYAENGLIENIQVVILIIAYIVYLLTAALEKRSERLILIFCALLCYSFILREVDVERLNIPYILISIGSGVGRNVTIFIAFAAIAYVALRNYSCYKKVAIRFIKTNSGYFLMAGGVFLFIGDFFEKHNLISHHIFFEEMFELSAYVLILLSSLTSDSFVSSITRHYSRRKKPCG